ncbi:MAG: hypothetical protein OEX09_05730 [Candidatus Bathyarchaeota archaeon]|nr:hypothetical protein [Candidatus Bathyarchaeota archaeon]
MEFNAKFLFLAVIFSLVSGVFYHLGTWLYLYLRLPLDLYSWIVLGLAPVQLVFGVVLPFAVMYVLSTRIGLEVAKSVMVSTFLGCWIGNVATFAADRYLLYFRGGSYSVDASPQFILWLIWEIFARAFSTVFFVSLAAILFAQYRKTADK